MMQKMTSLSTLAYTSGLLLVLIVLFFKNVLFPYRNLITCCWRADDYLEMEICQT